MIRISPGGETLTRKGFRVVRPGPFPDAAPGSIDATATVIGNEALSALGLVPASGDGLTAPGGLAAVSSGGVVVTQGDASGVVTGQAATSAIGVVAAAGTAFATPAGAGAATAVGASTADVAALGSPLGLQAISAVGAPVAAGVAVIAPVGRAAAIVTGLVASSGAAVAPLVGLEAIAAVGTPAATGIPDIPTIVALPLGLEAFSTIGSPVVSGEAFTEAVGSAATTGVGTVTTGDAPPVSGAGRWRFDGQRFFEQPRPPYALPATAHPRGHLLRSAVGVATASGAVRVVPVGVPATSAGGSAVATGIQNLPDEALAVLAEAA